MSCDHPEPLSIECDPDNPAPFESPELRVGPHVAEGARAMWCGRCGALGLFVNGAPKWLHPAPFHSAVTVPAPAPRARGGDTLPCSRTPSQEPIPLRRRKRGGARRRVPS